MRHQQQNLNPIDKSPEELLAQIRSLLGAQQQEQGGRHLSPNQIEEMLKQSYESSQVIRKKPSLKAAAQQRMQEAASLHSHSNHPPFVQHYTKQKIYSEMFTPLRNNISQEEQDYYHRHRQELLRQRRQEEQEEKERQQHAIDATRKFLSCESSKLPYVDINEFTQKEGNSSRSYLLNQPPEKTYTSVNNKIDDSQPSNLEAKFEQMKHTSMPSSPSHLTLHDDDIIQIIDQDDILDQQTVKEQAERQLFEALKHSPSFVRVFKHILLNQLALQKILNEEGSSKYRSSLNRSEGSFKYKNQPIILSKKVPEPQAESVASLTKKYRSKGIVLKDMGGQETVRSMRPITHKIISKMVGSSTEFHPKKAVLSENELSWCDEKEELKVDSKKVELTIQAIKVQRKTKEEGTFFNKKTTEVDVVVIQGTNRTLLFEKNYLEGAELYEQLCNLMAQKIYRLNIVIACKTNQGLYDFIRNRKASSFDLSNEFLQPHEKYPSRDYRIMMIAILTALFPYRQEVTRINCSACRTNVEENNMLFKALRFTKVQEITLSETKLNGECLSSLALYAATLPAKLALTLCNCMLEDTVLLAAKDALLKCSNIHKLNISQNSFTLQGFAVVLQLATQEKSCLTEINISENMITNFAVIGELIRKAKHLEVLIAENCGLNFEYEEELRHFFQNCRNSKIRKLSLLRNDIVNSLKNFEDFWVADTPKEISIDLGIYTEKTSKNLQGRLI